MSEQVNEVPADAVPAFDLIASIKNAITIIDYAANKGAFAGWDVVQQVLGVRAQLQGFVAAVEATMPAPADPADEPTEIANNPKPTKPKKPRKPTKTKD